MSDEEKIGPLETCIRVALAVQRYAESERWEAGSYGLRIVYFRQVRHLEADLYTENFTGDSFPEGDDLEEVRDHIRAEFLGYDVFKYLNLNLFRKPPPEPGYFAVSFPFLPSDQSR